MLEAIELNDELEFVKTEVVGHAITSRYLKLGFWIIVVLSKPCI